MAKAPGPHAALIWRNAPRFESGFASRIRPEAKMRRMSEAMRPVDIVALNAIIALSALVFVVAVLKYV
ncbi:MAG TPA: hypothetical protein VHA77_15065 [Xanthobacteraceae bacterium]|jgi:hypothetical protein|nr:hypothetical protein [Xanthobacteraceae bacterium]